MNAALEQVGGCTKPNPSSQASLAGHPRAAWSHGALPSACLGLGINYFVLQLTVGGSSEPALEPGVSAEPGSHLPLPPLSCPFWLLHSLPLSTGDCCNPHPEDQVVGGGEAHFWPLALEGEEQANMPHCHFVLDPCVGGSCGSCTLFSYKSLNFLFWYRPWSERSGLNVVFL